MSGGDAASLGLRPGSARTPSAIGPQADVQLGEPWSMPGSATPQTARGPMVVFKVDPGQAQPAPGTGQSQRSGQSQKSSKEWPRKSVKLPGTLKELNGAAVTHLQDSTGTRLAPGTAKMRLFHKGREMTHPTHVSDLRDNDEIIIRIDRQPRSLAGMGGKLMSTHQAHFVQHPIKPHQPRPIDGSAITEQLKQGRLEGRSCYANDYVQHPMGKRPSTSDANGSLYATHFLKQASANVMNKSTYASHFPWHNCKPIPPAGNDSESAVSDAMSGHRFTGRSSYAEDFPPRKTFAYPAKACGNDTASTLTDDQFRSPFDAKSQYTTDFVKFQTDGRQKSSRPRPPTPDGEQKFDGMSEYRHQYVGKKAQLPLVHLLVDD